MLRLALDIVLYSVVCRHISMSMPCVDSTRRFPYFRMLRGGALHFSTFSHYLSTLHTALLALSTSSVALPLLSVRLPYFHNLSLCNGRTTKPSRGKWMRTSIGDFTLSNLRGAITTSSVVNASRVPIVGLVALSAGNEDGVPEHYLLFTAGVVRCDRDFGTGHETILTIQFNVRRHRSR